MIVENLACSKHGNYDSNTVVLADGFSKQSPCPACKLDSEEMEAKRQQRQHAAHEREQADRRVQSILGRSGIPPRFAEKSFSNYSPADSKQRGKLDLCVDYAARFPEVMRTGQSMIFCGLTGTGKTHLACSIANSVIRDHHKTALFITLSRAFRLVKETYGKKSDTEQSVIDSFVRPDLLVLDDAGVQFGSDTERNITFDIVNERYERMKPTIITSNLSAEDLSQYLGDRVLDRMKENGGKVVVFDWQSNREKK